MAPSRSGVAINGEPVDIEHLPPFRPAPPSVELRAEWARQDERRNEQQRRQRETWPQTVEEAVVDQLKRLDESSKALIRATSEERLGEFHFGWGMIIRDAYGLWGGNEALTRSCGHSHPDDCSSVIMRAVWKALRS